MSERRVPPPPRPAPRSLPEAARLDLTGDVPVVVVDVDGWLDLASAPAVRCVVDDALAGRPRILAVDLSGCEVADAYGLGMLVRARRRGALLGTELVLVGVNRRTRRVLLLTGLVGELPVTELQRVSA